MDNEFEEKEMRDALDKMVNDFEAYKVEFNKLAGTCEAYELQCNTMNKTIEHYELLVKSAKQLILANDWEALKKLFSGVNI